MRVSLGLLLVLGAAGLHGQTAPDTTITVTGILKSQRVGASQWGLLLPQPVVVRGVPLTWLTIEGSPRGASNLKEHFVEAVGGARFRTDSGGAATVTLVDPRLKEREPPGTVHSTVQLSITQRAAVSLGVAPSQVIWHDSTGHASGARPILLFGLVNHGDAPIQMAFPRYEVICVRVWSVEPGVIDTSWALRLPGVQSLSLVMGAAFQEVLGLPPSAAPKVGRYHVRVELCGGEYGTETMFEVAG
jgi:hypothetical protein